MLDKIVSIKNVGRFRNYKARGNVRLERNTIVLGGNGHGKTTLCAILRSLQTNDSSHILGRRAVDAAGRATVKLIAGTEVRKFNGRSWKSHYPSLAVFDGEFVAQNVHSGDVVDLGHKRNLYRVIIGEAGVRLAREEFDVSKRSREMTREITAVEDRISPFVPTGMPLKTFIGLRADPKIAKRIKKQKRNLRAHERAQEVLERAPLSELGLPSLPKRLRELLARTVDDIANDAEARLQRHVAIHRMGRDGRNWIAKGVQYATGEDCPFCGQDIEELPLIGAYRSVFSEQYTDLKASIRTFQSKIEQHFGERAIGSLTRLSERNQAAAEFWRRYCDIEPDDFTLPVDTPEAIRKLRRAARKLLGRKSRSPLEAIQMNRTTFKSANAAFRRARSEAKALALRITAANEKINQVKSRARAADVRGAEAKLSRLKAVKRRHTTPVKKLCAKLSRKTGEKQEMDRKKSQLREELNNYTLHAMKPFQERINKFLAYFRTGFRIKNTRHAYPGAPACIKLPIGHQQQGSRPWRRSNAKHDSEFQEYAQFRRSLGTCPSLFPFKHRGGPRSVRQDGRVRRSFQQPRFVPPQSDSQHHQSLLATVCPSHHSVTRPALPEGDLGQGLRGRKEVAYAVRSALARYYDLGGRHQISNAKRQPQPI